MTNRPGAVDDVLRARVAQNAAERFASFRLRYDVYVAEQGKPYDSANHAERTLSDDLDDDGCTVIVESSNVGVVGTVRANWFDSDVTRTRYAAEFQLSRFSHVPLFQLSVCSRLAAAPEYRNMRARELLFETIYEIGIERRNTRLCFATCAPRLLRLFKRYGFREYLPPTQDPVVGLLHRVVLVLHDLEYLETVNSPFAGIAERMGVARSNDAWRWPDDGTAVA